MERAFIKWLGQLGTRPAATVAGTIGDDAAALRLSCNNCLVTTDLLAEGSHFVLAESGASGVGYKCLAVNLSDVAAMAARPVAAFVSLLLPRDGGLPLAQQLIEGMLPLAEKFQTVIAGGDTNVWDGPLVVNVTLVAEPTEHGILARSGAQVGDAILVSGALGGSLAGRHLNFDPRIEMALELNAHYDLHAGMDISDGLALDAFRMAEQSRCGIELDWDAIPIHQTARDLAAEDASKTALERALGDGEDFELLLAMPTAEAERLIHEWQGDVPLTRVGTCVAEEGLWRRDASGDRAPCPVLGFEH